VSNTLKKLHPHQIEGLDKLRASLLSGHRRPMLQAPTAYGKTILMASIIDNALAKGKRVMVCVPMIQLIDQTVEKFRDQGIVDVGVIQGNHWMTDWAKPVQVASVQTLQRRKSLPHADLVIIDEAHRWFKFYGDWMQNPDWAKTYFLGMSATPWTRGLGKFFDDLQIAATTQELIDKGYLSPFKVYAPSHPDLSSVQDVAGDYHEGQLSKAMQPLTADAVEAWKKHGEGRPTLVFAVDRAHAAQLQDRFLKSGVPAGYIDGNTPMVERTKIGMALQTGQLKVVVNIGCLTIGCDWPFVSCISLCRPTKSEMLYVQIIGRGLRTSPETGKVDCIVLDHSDTTERLGFVTDIMHDHLDDGSPRKAAERKQKAEERERPDECISCGALRRPKQKACWSCGFEAKRQSKVSFKDGILIEVTKKPKEPSLVEKQQWYSMLLHHAYAKGHKKGWAYHKYKERFGKGPSYQIKEITLEPNMEVASWIKSRNIRWAHSKNNKPEARP
jgi:DNA repair protein RadD